MKTNQLLGQIARQLSSSFIAGLFGFIVGTCWMNVKQLTFETADAISVKTEVAKYADIVIVEPTNNVILSNNNFVNYKDYTWNVREDAEMNDLLFINENVASLPSNAITQYVINSLLPDPPLEPRARSDLINTS